MSISSSRVSVVIPTYNRKLKLVRLIESILRSEYPANRLEIIVVDDASSDGTSEEIRSKFPHVKILRNKTEHFEAGSRNMGMRNSEGSLVFLVDDDNVVHPRCILELVGTMTSDTSIAVCGPITYYFSEPNRVWGAAIERNMTTSITRWIGRDEVDHGQFNHLIESKDFANAFMIRKDVLDRVGGFDERVFPTFLDEADFCAKVKKMNLRIVCNPRAKAWHDIATSDTATGRTRLHHVRTPKMAYYIARNRILFSKRYASRTQFLAFVTIFKWLLAAYYVKVIMQSSYPDKLQIAKNYMKGVFDGIAFRSTRGLKPKL